MEDNVREKLQMLLRGQIRYSSENLAFNMLIKKLQRRVEQDPRALDICINEAKEFAEKYPKITATDFAKIASL